MRTFATATAFLLSATAASILACAFTARAQQPSPEPSPKSEQTADHNSAAQKTDDPAAPATEVDLLHRETMTGDWGGTRTHWKERGVEMDFSLTGFAQGTAAGGLTRETVLNGKFESKFKFDFEKLAGWKNWSAEARFEYRYGAPVLARTGAINTVNTDVTIPASQGSIAAVTGLKFTRVFPLDTRKGNEIAISFGRYNTLEIQETFFGGMGLDKFFNAAQIGPMTGLRQVPNVTNGASIDYVRHGESFISFGILDPNDSSTTVGLHHVFRDGVTLAPVLNIPSKWRGRDGKHSFSYTVTTKKFTPFDAIKNVVIPGPPLSPVQPKGGSFSLSYVGRQFLVERGKDDGWGIFTQLSIADQDTSPVTRFFDIGLGGNGLWKRRSLDDFGIAYAYTGLSRVLKDNLNVVSLGNVRPHSEHQFEGFYNFHFTPWLRLTGDLQIIRPVVRRATTAIIPGARVEMIF